MASKLSTRVRTRGIAEVARLGLDRVRETISSNDRLVMHSVDPATVIPRELEGAISRIGLPEDGRDYASDIGTDSAATFAARLSLDTTCYLVEMEGRIVHASWVTNSAAWTRELNAYVRPPSGHRYIYESFTAPSARGHGVYPFALGEICKDSVAKGSPKVWVAVEASNTASLRAVAKVGFVPEFEIAFRRSWGRVTIAVPADKPSPAPEISAYPTNPPSP